VQQGGNRRWQKNIPATDGDSDLAEIATEHGESVERLTGAIIAVIEEADASYSQTKHALTRALGAIIGSNSCDYIDRAAAVSVASRAIAGCANSSPLITKHGRRLRRSRDKPVLWASMAPDKS
jgi:hypothetical protein